MANNKIKDTEKFEHARFEVMKSRTKMLCDRAQALFMSPINKNRTKIRFSLHGKDYIADMTIARIRVHDASGNPICCRYF